MRSFHHTETDYVFHFLKGGTILYNAWYNFGCVCQIVLEPVDIIHGYQHRITSGISYHIPAVRLCSIDQEISHQVSMY